MENGGCPSFPFQNLTEKWKHPKMVLQKFSQPLPNDSLTLQLNDLQQSEFPAYWQA
jgi:hypothetical protein